jgi:hypothetical protein
LATTGNRRMPPESGSCRKRDWFFRSSWIFDFGDAGQNLLQIFHVKESEYCILSIWWQFCWNLPTEDLIFYAIARVFWDFPYHIFRFFET